MLNESLEDIMLPSKFMRKLRPELYSDSFSKKNSYLKEEVLSHHLDTITERNQTHDFELFCRKLCERTICPNLRPATGPEGGGDSKADTETTPVSDEISKLTYFGMANSGSERWAFAFSAKKTWADKVRSDVAGIMSVGRGYKKIFFVTSRAARAKDRARVEDELSKKYGVLVTIHDRAWIIDEIIHKNRRDLAFHYLGIGDEVSNAELGPSDYSRRQQLDDIERELGDPSAFAGMKVQRAAEALVAAKLARALEIPRTEIDGMFLRAIRLADDGGTERQKITARYEMLWTEFWWFDDITAVVNGYDAFEALLIENEHAKNLELLCNLVQLLFNIVIHGHLTAEKAGLVERVSRVSRRLSELSNNTDRPNNALEAATSLLNIKVNESIVSGDTARLSSLWREFSEVLSRADGLGEFDADRLVKLIEAYGQIAGKDQGYRDLVDQVFEFVTKRTGESQGAKVLLKRACQLDFDESMEMIRLLGKAARQLTKKEHAADLVRAQTMLATAYQHAGLLWAARASSTSAAVTLFIEAEEYGELPDNIFPVLMNLAWQTVELKYFPEALQIVQVAQGCLKSLSYDDEYLKSASEQLHDFDMVLACQIVNVPYGDVSNLEEIPDVLQMLDLPYSWIALLYVLGHEDRLRSDKWFPEGEPAAGVARFFNLLAGQPAGDACWRPAIFNGPGMQVLTTSVLGVQINVTHESTDTGVTVAEGIAGIIEVFFATVIELEAFAHVECFDIYVVESENAQFQIELDVDRMRATVSWPAGKFPGSPSIHSDFVNMLLEIAVSVFSAVCHANDLEGFTKRLFSSDSTMDRVALVGTQCISRERIFGGVSRITDWRKYSPSRFEVRKDRPVIVRELPPRSKSESEKVRSTAGKELPNVKDHRDIRVHSVVDVHLWDRAEWKGVAYGIADQKGTPFLALMFRDPAAARKIFERWRDRFGLEDKHEEIHIGIVRQFSPEHPAHYGMVLTSRVPLRSDVSQVAMLATRSLTMEPSNDINLSGFLKLYESQGEYLLMPMVIVPGQQPYFIDGLSLLKRELHVKLAADIGEDDVDNVFLRSRGVRL